MAIILTPKELAWRGITPTGEIIIPKEAEKQWQKWLIKGGQVDPVTGEVKWSTILTPSQTQTLIGKIDIPITEAELQKIAQAEAAGQCMGAMKAYYTVKTYKATLKGGSQIYIEALSVDSAKKKAKDAGYEVAWVTTVIGGTGVTEEKLEEKPAEVKGDFVKDYIEGKGGKWKDDYLTEGGYNLLLLVSDSQTDVETKFTLGDLRKIFGEEAVKEAVEALPAFMAYNELKDYTHNVPSDPYGPIRDNWMPPLTYTDEIILGDLIEDKGIEKTITLLENVGIEEAEEFVKAYNEMPEHWQNYANQYGFALLQFKIDNCADALKDYKQPDGSYDIYTALIDAEDWVDAKVKQNSISFLFGQEDLDGALNSLRAMRVEVTAPYPVPGDKVGGEDVKTLWDKARETSHTIGTYIAGANSLPLWVLDNAYSPEAQAYMQGYAEEYKNSPWYKKLFTDLAVAYLSPEQLNKMSDKHKNELRENGIDLSKGMYTPVVGGYGPMILPASTPPTKIAQQALQWYWRAPANAVMKIASKIPGLMTLPIIRGIPQLATTAVRMVTVGVPAYYTAAYIAEKVKDTDLQRKWNIFNNLPEKEKDKWARECGYDKWEGLTEGQQSAVLGRYAVPTSYTTTEWAGALGEYTQKLIEIGDKGADWIFGQQLATPNIQQASIGGVPVQYAGAFGIGVGTGLAESLMYMAAIPLVLTNIFIRVPTGEAWGYTKWVAGGMLEFFKEIPATFVSGPFGAGRMIGLFVLSPETAYKLSKGAVTALKPSYIPERAMGMRMNTLRVIFTAKQLDLLSEMSSAQLKLLGTRIAETLMKGESYVKGFGRIKLEVKTVPYQQVVGNALWHFTPDITPFLKGERVPIIGKLYTSPHAAMSAGIQSLVKGVKASKPGLVEVRVPEGYLIKGAPIEKLLASGRAVEIEAPLKGTLEPIPGFTGKGVSSNMYFGSYPIRRFTLLGVDTPIKKLALPELIKIRALAAKEALFDVFLGWNGRLEAIKKDLGGARKLKETLQNIDNSIASVKESASSIVGKDGRIVSQIEFKHPSGGLINEKVRGLIIDNQGRVLFVRDRADPVGVYDAVGGSCNVKEVLIPEKGKWNYNLPAKERPVVTWELAFRSQAFGELNIKVKNVDYMGMYRGKVGEHSVYGTRIYESRVDSGYFDRVVAWEKYQKPTYKYAEPEIAEAFWWDGKMAPKGAVQPWFYDMLAAVARKYGWDMSKVKVSTLSGKFVRDFYFPERVIRGKNPDLTTAQRKAAEVDLLKGTYSRITMPGLGDYVLRGGADIALIAELIKGRRQAVKWSSTDPVNLPKAASYLIRSLESLSDKIRRMTDEVFRESYGSLGLSRRALLNRINTLKLQQLLEAYKRNSTKSNLGRLGEEINRLGKAQTDLANRWLMEWNVKGYLDAGVVSGRYAMYLDKAIRVMAAGKNADRLPLWDELPEYEAMALPSVDYVLGYGYPRDESRQFTYTTDYTIPAYTELGRYTNYAEQPEYQKAIAAYVPEKYVAPPSKPPEYKVPVKEGVTYPPYPPYPPTPPYPPYPPMPPTPKQKVVLIESENKKYYKIPKGSIAWRQGSKLRGKELRSQWYFIPPPWTQEKPVSLDYPPLGAKYTGETTPEKTIQMIGKPGAKVPKDVAIDLGVVDIYISDYGKNIRFAGGGLETSVGKSLAETTKGMSIPASGRMIVKKKSKPRRRIVASASVG